MNRCALADVDARMLQHVTFTGWDEATDLAELEEFCAECVPNTIEIAVLASLSKESEERYPRPAFAADILAAAHRNGQRTAIHFCGALARHLLLGGLPRAQERLPEWNRATALAQRIQINVPQDTLVAARSVFLHVPETVPFTGPDAIKSVADRIEGKDVILQARGAEFPAKEHDRLFWLFDRSGGRGETPGAGEWPRPQPGRLVGYAGGLGPDNAGPFAAFMHGAASALDGQFWIDMESKIRERYDAHPGGARASESDQDIGTYLSIDKCRQVVSEVRRLLPAR